MIFEIRSKFSAGEAFYLQYGCRSQQNPRKSEKLKVFFYFLMKK